jgi:hypothetical protein
MVQILAGLLKFLLHCISVDPHPVSEASTELAVVLVYVKPRQEKRGASVSEAAAATGSTTKAYDFKQGLLLHFVVS